MNSRRVIDQPVSNGAGTQRGSATPMLVLVLTAILLVLGTVALKVTTSDLQASANTKSATEALFLAESGIEHARAKLGTLSLDSALKTVDSSRFSSGQQVTVSDTNLRLFTDTFASGSFGKYRVFLYDNDDGDGDIRADSDERVFVKSIGILNAGGTRAIEVALGKVGVPTFSGQGAVIAAGNVNLNGVFKIDGREHDINGNRIGSGTHAIVSNGTFTMGSAAARVGGTNVVDYDLSNNAATIASVTQSGAGLPVPTGPDNAVGLADGSLELIAKSGSGGSQYVTDPSHLRWPLTGVTYVDLPCGGSMEGYEFGAGNTGVLVVHSPCTDGLLKAANAGTFQGIVIADDLVNTHFDVIGQIIQLSTTPSAGHILGNGNGDIKFSSAAISMALTGITKVVFVTAWREL